MKVDSRTCTKFGVHQIGTRHHESQCPTTLPKRPEYLPWYHPGAEFLRCSGCAALIVEGDIEVHNRHHERLETCFSSVR